jgi:DNA repair exonuclease SbcCD ATPase subunit
MEEIEITIKDLHDFLSLHPEEKGRILIEGKDGWCEIDESAITAPNSEFYTIKTENGKKAQCSPDHLFYTGDWVKCKNLKAGDLILTDSGYSAVSYLNLEEEREDLYDIEVRSSHNYFGNGILSHNSSISQVITFGLYGKLEGKKLKDIPNRINGNAWMKITLESYGSEIVVERGLEPNIFRLYIDGVEYDQAGVRSVQDYLAEDILGIPYYVFNNTISLSINDFKSFIKMSSQDKRSIIDKIFGFHVLNQMRDLLKEENRKIRESMENLGGRLSSVESTIQSSLNEMENLANQIEEESSSKREELQKSLETFEGLQILHNQKTDEFREIENELNSEITNTQRLVIESRTKLQEVQKKIKLYDLDQCPTCQTSLDSEFHHCIKDGLVADQSSVSQQLEESNALMLDLKQKERDLSTTKRGIMDKGKKIEMKIGEIRRDLKSLNESSNDKQLQSLQRIVDNLQGEREKMETESFKNQEKNNWLRTLDEILGEKGVKQMAIRTILPSLNSEILDLLAKMHLDYQVIFDEEFNATIYHMGVEIPTQTLSTGEMKKVDFVVLIAIMKLMKMKFSSINLLFLDELFSSVDPDGVHSILKILRSVCKDLGLNIFVINHAPMPHEIFDWKLEVTKANNFSSISIDKF